MPVFNEKDRESWDGIFGNIRPEWARAWKSVSPTEDMQDCLSFFRENSVASILDVGCGVGVWAVYLARSGFSVSAADFSAPAIVFAKEWALEENLRINFGVAAITEEPFKGTLFDATVASKILENVRRDEMATAIETLWHSLKPAGVIYALFNPYMTAEQIEAVQASDNPTKNITNVVYTDEELKSAFSKFELLRFKTYPQGWRALFLRKPNGVEK